MVSRGLLSNTLNILTGHWDPLLGLGTAPVGDELLVGNLKESTSTSLTDLTVSCIIAFSSSKVYCSRDVFFVRMAVDGLVAKSDIALTN